MGEVFDPSNTSVCLVIRKDPVLFPVLEAHFMANNFSLVFHIFEFFSMNIQFNTLHVSHAKFANYFIQNSHTFTVIFLLFWSVTEKCLLRASAQRVGLYFNSSFVCVLLLWIWYGITTSKVKTVLSAWTFNTLSSFFTLLHSPYFRYISQAVFGWAFIQLAILLHLSFT